MGEKLGLGFLCYLCVCERETFKYLTKTLAKRALVWIVLESDDVRGHFVTLVQKEYKWNGHHNIPFDLTVTLQI